MQINESVHSALPNSHVNFNIYQAISGERSTYD
jgi:hypothetical protein